MSRLSAEGEVLVDELDPEGGSGARVVERDRLALEEDGAAVDAVDAGDALHERRLTGAVVADQRGDLARIDVEVDVVEDVDRAETLVELTDLEDGRSHRAFLLGRWQDAARWPDGTTVRPAIRDSVMPVLLDAQFGARGLDALADLGDRERTGLDHVHHVGLRDDVSR